MRRNSMIYLKFDEIPPGFTFKAKEPDEYSGVQYNDSFLVAWLEDEKIDDDRLYGNGSGTFPNIFGRG